MMSVLATLPTRLGGLEGAVLYIDTESAFTAERSAVLFHYIAFITFGF